MKDARWTSTKSADPPFPIVFEFEVEAQSHVQGTRSLGPRLSKEESRTLIMVLILESLAPLSVKIISELTQGHDTPLNGSSSQLE